MDHAHPGPTNQYSAAHPGMACQFEPSLGSDGYILCVPVGESRPGSDRYEDNHVPCLNVKQNLMFMLEFVRLKSGKSFQPGPKAPRICFTFSAFTGHVAINFRDNSLRITFLLLNDTNYAFYLQK